MCYKVTDVENALHIIFGLLGRITMGIKEFLSELLSLRLRVRASTTSSNSATVTLPRDLAIVAHLDDDLLFMNPDIMTSIRAGNTVRTIYITAMIASDEEDYWCSREQGVQAAYAHMARVNNRWLSHTYAINGYVHHMVTLVDAPQVSLVFLRLPDNADPRPEVITFRRLEAGTPNTVIATIDGGSSYTKQEFVDHLVHLVLDFAPTTIRLQDWQTTADNDHEVAIPETADHPDHIRTARLVRQAVREYSRPHKTIWYRNYNIQFEAPNLAPEVCQEKTAVFLQYAEHDSLLDGDAKRPYSVSLSVYEPWYARQYTAPEPPAIEADKPEI